MFDSHFDPPEILCGCAACGEYVDNCSCPQCPSCGEHGNPDCFGREGHLPDSKMVVWDIADLLTRLRGKHQFTEKESESRVARILYKASRCGVTFGKVADKFATQGVYIGGYCEEPDVDIQPEILQFPFTEDEFWKAAERADNAGCAEGDQTHGCEDCWPDGYCDDLQELAFGCWPINPECKSCEGEGCIL